MGEWGEKERMRGAYRSGLCRVLSPPRALSLIRTRLQAPRSPHPPPSQTRPSIFPRPVPPLIRAPVSGRQDATSGTRGCQK